MTKESRRHPSHAPRDPSEDDAKTLVRRFGCCERGWTRVWNVDVEAENQAKVRAAERGLGQVLLREGRRQSRTRSPSSGHLIGASRPRAVGARGGASEILKMRPDEYP